MNRGMKEVLIGGDFLGLVFVVGACIGFGSNASPAVVFSL